MLRYRPPQREIAHDKPFAIHSHLSPIFAEGEVNRYAGLVAILELYNAAVDGEREELLNLQAADLASTLPQVQFGTFTGFASAVMLMAMLAHGLARTVLVLLHPTTALYSSSVFTCFT